MGDFVVGAGVIGAAVSPDPKVGAVVTVTHAPLTAHCPPVHTHLFDSHTAFLEAAQFGSHQLPHSPPVSVLHEALRCVTRIGSV